jgi:hypothetical protein
MSLPRTVVEVAASRGDAMWERLALDRSSAVLPTAVWGWPWLVNDVPVVALARSVNQPWKT